LYGSSGQLRDLLTERLRIVLVTFEAVRDAVATVLDAVKTRSIWGDFV
jgi:hypothetical protein